MRFLRQNTAVIVTVGPFYDKTDGVTIETALTITNERITLTADTDDNNAPTNILDNVTGATSGTANDLNYITANDAGMMQLELSAANTNRVGRMMLSITDAANHVPVFHEFFVLPQAIYDWFTGVIVPLPSNMTQILGTAVSTPATAGILDVNVKNIDNDAASASGTVTFPNATLASTTNITAAAGIAVSSIGNNVITASSIAADAITAAKVADGTIDAATFAASAITATSLASDCITAAKIATGAIDADAIAANAITSSTFANDSITAAAIAADAIGSSELAATAVTEIAVAVELVTGANVSAIKTVTDQFVFTTANRVDSSVMDKTGFVLSATGSAALTEGYAADGAAPTLNQMLYQIWSALSEFSISGTTITAKKLDGSTTAMTFTLDDSANPTSRTRAT